MRLGLLKLLCAGMSVIMLLASLLFGYAQPAHAAPAPVDLKVTLDAPTTAPRAALFEHRVTVENLSGNTADGATISYRGSTGTTNLRITCDAAADSVNGAACPSNIQMQGAFTINGKIAQFPAGSKITFTVSGRYPNHTSASMQVEARPVSGQTDTDLSSNKVNQQTALQGGPVTIWTTKTASASVFTVGQEMFYDITYHNRGTTDAHALQFDDNMVLSNSNGQHQRITNYESSFTCTVETSADVTCPEWADGSVTSYTNTSASRVRVVATGPNTAGIGNAIIDIPAGSKLALRVRIKITALDSNVPDCGDLKLNNNTAVRIPAGYSSVNSRVFAGVNSTLQRSACAVADVVTQKTVDKQTTTVPDDTLTYTLRYENRGPNEVNDLVVLDNLRVSAVTGGSVTIAKYQFEVSCAPGNTAPCPAWAMTNTPQIVNNNSPLIGILGSSQGIADTKANIPQGTTLLLQLRVKILDYGPQAPTCGDIRIQNDAEYRVPSHYQEVTASSQRRSTAFTIVDLADCATAKIRVLKEVAQPVYALAEEMKFRVTYQNYGTVDVNDLALKDQLRVNEPNGTRRALRDYELTVSCEHTVNSVDCPAWADGQLREYAESTSAHAMFLFTDFHVNSNGISNAKVDLPAGKELVLVVVLNTKAVPANIQNCDEMHIHNSASFQLPTGYVPAPGNNHAGVGTKILNPCNDVSTTTHISSNTPAAAEPLTVTVQVTNSTGTAYNVPVTVELPAGGFRVNPVGGVLPATTEPECVVTKVDGSPAPPGVTCPAAWSYNPDTRKLESVIAEIPKDVRYEFRFAGRAGIRPSLIASYRVTTIAPSVNDNIPVANSMNQSDTTFGVTNTSTTASVQVTVTGLVDDQASEELTFTGVMSCADQGDFPVTVLIPQGSNQAQVTVANTLWKHDDCTVTMQTPGQDPHGYSWKPWTIGPVLAKTNIVNPALFAFEIPVKFVPTAPDLPYTGGLSADYIYFSGIGLLIIAGLVSFIVLWRKTSAELDAAGVQTTAVQ